MVMLLILMMRMRIMVTSFRKKHCQRHNGPIFSKVEITTTKNVKRKIHQRLILEHVADLYADDDGDDLDNEEVDDDEDNFEDIQKIIFKG